MIYTIRKKQPKINWSAGVVYKGMIITMGIKSNLIKHLKETILANIKIIKFEAPGIKE